MASHLISDGDIARYSKAPSPATVTAVSNLQNAIRDALGNNYETFLQGSYRNDTSIRDVNDVDIVAVLKTAPGSWMAIFNDVHRRLESLSLLKGKTSYGDKCVRVIGARKADVLPAVAATSYDEDPIAIYSFRQNTEMLTYPRTHYENAVEKQRRTGQTYKAVVRMFKKWAANHWPSGGVARSFHLESLVYNVPDDQFQSDLALAFVRVASYVAAHLPPHPAPLVRSVAGDRNILVESEWKAENYARFHAQVGKSVILLLCALKATSQSDASKFWRAAFNE